MHDKLETEDTQTHRKEKKHTNPNISPSLLQVEEKEKIEDSAAQRFFKFTSKSSFEKCVFLNLFHRTRVQNCPSTSEATAFSTSLKRFIISYMRHWEDLRQYSVVEKRFIIDFLEMEHKKLTKPEFDMINLFVCQCAGTFQFEKSKSFLEFTVMVRDYIGVGLYVRPNNTPSKPSLLHEALIQSTSSEDAQRHLQIASSDSEIFRLYVCVYYPNYLELWDSKYIILQGPLIDAIDRFLKSHPHVDNLVLNSILDCI